MKNKIYCFMVDLTHVSCLLVTESSAASGVNSSHAASQSPPVSSEINVPVQEGIDLHVIPVVNATSVLVSM